MVYLTMLVGKGKKIFEILTIKHEGGCSWEKPYIPTTNYDDNTKTTTSHAWLGV